MLFDVIGWIGMILILLAYALLSLGKIKNGIIYQLINLLAGVFMAIGVFPKKVWFSFTLEIIWSIIAIVSLIKLAKHNK